MSKVNRVKPDPKEVLQRLARIFTSTGAMDFKDSYVTLVGVVLSARTRDEQVLLALPAFLQKFPTPGRLAEANVEDILYTIRTIGMNKQKAKNLKGLGEKLVNEFGGKVPHTMEELISLPGVGRKTASVVLSAAFNTEAIAVDTHVHRVANRLNWSKANTPSGTEKDLLKLIPLGMHKEVNRVFVKFGRYICLPGKPRCGMCPLQDICPYGKKNMTLPKSKDVLTQDWQRREKILNDLRDEVIAAYKRARRAQISAAAPKK